MTRRGKPLWFLGWVTCGWIGLRVMMLWPAAPRLLVPSVHAATPRPAPRERPSGLVVASPVDVAWVAKQSAFAPSTRRPVTVTAPDRGPLPAGAIVATDGVSQRRGFAAPLATAPLPPIVSPAAAMTRTSRWGASLWLLARGQGGSAGLNGPELGGSQAGLRVTYALDEHRRLALAVRVAAPLGEPGRESALGIEWQPSRLPVRLIADQRFMLDRGRGGPEIGVIAGIGPQPVAPGVTLAAYGQAGVIKRAMAEGYADGAARLTHDVARVGGVRLELGGGAWGGIQPGTRRIDLGPTAALAFAVAGHGARLSLDWRERVAGNARPGSGPALTLGADF